MQICDKLYQLLYHIIIDPLPLSVLNKPWRLCVYITSLLKTLWEKEKLHDTNTKQVQSRIHLK